MSEPTRIVASAPTEPPTIHQQYGILPGETWAEWGARTGRYTKERIPFWQGLLDEEAREIKASGGQPSGSYVAGQIVRLVPMLVEDTTGRIMASGAPDNRPLRITAEYGGPVAASEATQRLSRLEQIDRDLWGPTREQRWAEQDHAAEAEIAAQDDHRRIAASSALTDDEFGALFGDA